MKKRTQTETRIGTESVLGDTRVGQEHGQEEMRRIGAESLPVDTRLDQEKEQRDECRCRTCAGIDKARSRKITETETRMIDAKCVLKDARIDQERVQIQRRG